MIRILTSHNRKWMKKKGRPYSHILKDEKGDLFIYVKGRRHYFKERIIAPYKPRRYENPYNTNIPASIKIFYPKT